jgi:hypothetical protein
MGVPHIRTEQSLMFMNGPQPITVPNDHPKYKKLDELIKKGILSEDGVTYREVTGDELQAVYEEERRAVEAALHAVDLTESLSIQDGILRYKGRALDNYVARKLIESVKEGFIANNPLIPFIDKLMQNPSNRAVQQLYPFLEKGNIALAPNGNFVAFKAIRANWTDIHSGTFDNSIGQEVWVNRNEVDEDPDVTCSHGLHVCSYDYLPHFAHADGHVIIVEVNPADVVAIPRDYNDTKMRVCRYVVVDEYKGYYKNEGNILSKASVYTGRPFGVRVRKNETEEFDTVNTFDGLGEAVREYEALCEKYYEVQIYNTSTDVVIDENQDSELRVAPEGASSGSNGVQLYLGDEERYDFTVKCYNSLQDYEDKDAVETEGYDDEDEARDRAKELMDDYPIVEIVDEDGDVVKTYGYTH